VTRGWVPVCLALAAALVPGCGSSPTSSPPPAESSIAVLPFEVVGQDEGAEYLGPAFADALATILGEVDGVHLAESPEGATRVLTGTLTRKGEDVHGAVRLIDPANNDAQAWELDARSEGDSLSSLASGLARLVVGALGLEYPAVYGYIADVTVGPEIAASPLVARVEEARRQGDIGEFVEASRALTERYGDDPATHVLNGWALTRAWDADPSGETLSRLKDRLVALDRVDPSSPYDELLRAYIYRSSGEPDQARVLYSQVLSRSDLAIPTRAWALRQRSLASLQMGDLAAARRDAEQSVALDPVNAQSFIALSKALEALNLTAEAAEASKKALILEPYQWRHHQRLGIVYIRGGHFDLAPRSIEKACEMGGSQEACANLAVTLERAGRSSEARGAAEHAASLAATAWGLYNLACYRSISGDVAGALADLRGSSELGFADALITTDPDLASLRGDSRFEAVVAEVEDRLRTRREISDSVFPWQG